MLDFDTAHLKFDNRPKVCLFFSILCHPFPRVNLKFQSVAL